jgi:hypothetical protein
MWIYVVLSYFFLLYIIKEIFNDYTKGELDQFWVILLIFIFTFIHSFIVFSAGGYYLIFENGNLEFS